MSSQDLRKDARQVAEATAWNPMRMLRKWGVRSSHAYTAGLLSVGLSVIAWLLSRGKNDPRPQSDRWGLFVGEWAPTFFAIGVGLKLEEQQQR